MSVGKLYDLIDNEKFVHHFQALYDLHSLTPIGYEALLRTTLFKNPEILFDKASRTDRFFDLEIRSIRKALKTYDEINKYSTNNNKLLLNVFPSNLTNENFFSDFHEIVNDLSIHPNQIVIEINESEIIQNIDLFHDTILQLQENDYLIALDDVGKGVSTLQAIVELQPDYVKMDRYFAKDLAQSTRKQEMIRAISNFCQNTDSKFVLEGIEILEDLEVAKSIGVSIVQGFLLARPEPISIIKKYELPPNANNKTAN